MYRLTPKMEQSLQQSLQEYHNLFNDQRCSGIELEELIFKAIQLDSSTGHHASWKAGGHDPKFDIRVTEDSGQEYLLQIKSGSVRGNYLNISGYRLGDFDGDLPAITEHLNNVNSEILSIPYRKVDDNTGRHHIYQIIYIDSEYLHGLGPSGWEESGTAWIQTNLYGVKFSLRPTMSWQIWWQIPKDLLDKCNKSKEIVID